uniref:Uncharacterized protein n=1 Tax=Arundo donax TaxID=35708 RepID=A0A0A9B397_ARUDO
METTKFLYAPNPLLEVPTQDRV